MHEYVLVVLDCCLLFDRQVHNLLTNLVVVVRVDVFALEVQLVPNAIKLFVYEVARISVEKESHSQRLTFVDVQLE